MKILAFIFLFSFSFLTSAQDMVQWSMRFDEDRSELVVEAQMESGWHIYSQHLNPESGPIPTSIDFVETTDVMLIGSTKEPEPIEDYDPNFGSTVLYFEKEAQFSQKLIASAPVELTCIVTFMVCNDSTCFPPEEVSLTLMIPKTSNN